MFAHYSLSDPMLALHNAARNGDQGRLRELLEDGFLWDDYGRESRDWYGRTALHEAAYWGHTACLEALLDTGASVHSGDQYGNTPLYYASIRGHVTCVRLLVDAGSDANRRNWFFSRVGQGRTETPISGATRKGHDRVLSILRPAEADAPAARPLQKRHRVLRRSPRHEPESRA